jgi:hypothetical protein
VSAAMDAFEVPVYDPKNACKRKLKVACATYKLIVAKPLYVFGAKINCGHEIALDIDTKACS